jgi:WD40 repeat protein
MQTIAITPDGKLVVSAVARADMRKQRTTHAVAIWNVESGTLRKEVSTDENQIADIDVSPDGNYIAAAMDDGSAHIWQIGGELVVSWDAHRGGALCLAWSADGKLLATGGRDGSVLVRSVADVLNRKQR